MGGEKVSVAHTRPLLWQLLLGGGRQIVFIFFYFLNPTSGRLKLNLPLFHIIKRKLGLCGVLNAYASV